MVSAGLLRECRATYAWWERFAASWTAARLMLVWAFAEAIVWPIIPDFLLIPMAAVAGRRFYITLAAAAVGSALGGTLWFVVAVWQPQWALSVVPNLPFVPPRHVEGVREALVTHGTNAFLLQPWSGIPFKVWAPVAAGEGVNSLVAVPVFILARSARMAIAAAAAAGVGALLRRFLRDFSIFVAAIYAVLFAYGWWQLSS